VQPLLPFETSRRRAAADRHPALRVANQAEKFSCNRGSFICIAGKSVQLVVFVLLPSSGDDAMLLSAPLPLLPF
jgi:hypothetical protein